MTPTTPMLCFGPHWSLDVRVAPRASIVLLAAQGLQNKAVAERFGVGRVQVARWLEAGLEGIERDLLSTRTARWLRLGRRGQLLSRRAHGGPMGCRDARRKKSRECGNRSTRSSDRPRPAGDI